MKVVCLVRAERLMARAVAQTNGVAMLAELAAVALLHRFDFSRGSCKEQGMKVFGCRSLGCRSQGVNATHLLACAVAAVWLHHVCYFRPG